MNACLQKQFLPCCPSCFFLLLLRRDGGRIGPARKAWMLVGGFFAAVGM